MIAHARPSQQRKVSDADLITRYMAGDEAAFTELHARYATKLKWFIRKFIGDTERSEDLTQETFLRVFRHLGDFDGSRKFSTWIYTIAKNQALNELRNTGRRATVSFSVLQGNQPGARPIDIADPHQDVEAAFRCRNLSHSVGRVIETLSPNHRQIIRLRFQEDRTYEEIAVITKCKPGTVKSRLSRAREQVAKALETL